MRTQTRKSRALDPEVKAMRAIRRAIDGLEPQERQRVMEWAVAYSEGASLSSGARYRMALDAILTLNVTYTSQRGLDDAKLIAKKAISP